MVLDWEGMVDSCCRRPWLGVQQTEFSSQLTPFPLQTVQRLNQPVNTSRTGCLLLADGLLQAADDAALVPEALAGLHLAAVLDAVPLQLDPVLVGLLLQLLEVGVLLQKATSNGRLRATLPKAPKAFPANRHTVKQQDREDKPRQRVMSVRASAESQSLDPSSRQEPQRRMCAVLWSSLSQRKSKAKSAGAKTSPAHSASLWIEARYELEGSTMQRTAESPSRKRPTEGAL
ncbi:hypothetical protein EYF80_011335 [Liparis tanakae]|uniref:Uncharacterized protein n=1 Tax=Liparis tanakae TaxID=230148 RepID=A0A4Z2IKP7_9TELE|nr:hypothetical protein EYF80_011335 [Liparis tanakae]